MPPKKKTDDKPLSLRDTLAKLKSDGVRIGFDEVSAEPKFYTTGNMVIDALGSGGLPVGKVVEFVGPPASGKTTAAVSAAGRIMEAGGIVAFFDYERAIDKPYFRALGVDPDSEQFLYFTPRHAEEGANTFRKLVATGEIDMGIFDSVAAMVTQEELEAETGKVSVGARAKMLHQFLRQLKDSLADNETTVVFLNHLMEKVDITYMGQQMAARGIKRYTSPGGQAIPFYASLRLSFEKSGDISVEQFDPLLNETAKVKIGSKHKVKVLKNKVGRPGGEAEVINVIGEGFSQVRTAMDILLKYNAVKKSGSWFKAADPRLVAEFDRYGQVQGENKLYELLMVSPSLRATAISVASEILTEAIKAQEVSGVEDLELGNDQELPEEFASQKGVFSGA